MQLIDADGNSFLDFYNNVVSVGHCHPLVSAAIAQQAHVLNTNTRYILDETVRYAEAILATVDDSLDSIVFCNSGSEANDLAYRLCKANTGHTGGLTMRHGYHGITDAMAAFTPALSPKQIAPHIRTLEPPHTYRGPFRHGHHDALGDRYAALVDEPVRSLQESGHGVACTLVDSLFMSNGVLDAPAGYLAQLCEKTRAAGGLYVADEVQAGFNRTGETMFGHQRHHFVPDVVTIGKPAGNGHPLAAMITRRELLDQFRQDTGFFSTFGGNNVSCAAGLAVLQVMQEENLRENAREMGAYFKQGLESIKQSHAQVIGDVRGVGLALGVEFVRNVETREPAHDFCMEFLRRFRDAGIIAGSDGEHQNCVKMRPPLIVQKKHIDEALEKCDKVLKEMTRD